MKTNFPKIILSSWKPDIQTTVDSRYLEHRAISNKTLGPFSTNSSGVTTRYLELPAISNILPGPLRVRDSGSRLYITYYLS